MPPQSCLPPPPPGPDDRGSTTRRPGIARSAGGSMLGRAAGPRRHEERAATGAASARWRRPVSAPKPRVRCRNAVGKRYPEPCARVRAPVCCPCRTGGALQRHCESSPCRAGHRRRAHPVRIASLVVEGHCVAHPATRTLASTLAGPRPSGCPGRPRRPPPVRASRPGFDVSGGGRALGSGPVRQSLPRPRADSAPALVATARRRPRSICSPPEIRVNARSGQGRRRGPFATDGCAPSASDTTP